MERGRAGAQFAPRVLAEVRDPNFTQIDFRETHGSPMACRLRHDIDIVDEDRHPLISCSVCIDRSPDLPGRLDFHAFGAGFHGVVGVRALYHQVGMSIEIGIHRQCPRMLGDTRREQV